MNRSRWTGLALAAALAASALLVFAAYADPELQLLWLSGFFLCR